MSLSSIIDAYTKLRGYSNFRLFIQYWFLERKSATIAEVVPSVLRALSDWKIIKKKHQGLELNYVIF
jgi:hypothetical protein